MSHASIYGTDDNSLAHSIAGDALGSSSPDRAGAARPSKGNHSDKGPVKVTDLGEGGDGRAKPKGNH